MTTKNKSLTTRQATPGERQTANTVAELLGYRNIDIREIEI